MPETVVQKPAMNWRSTEFAALLLGAVLTGALQAFGVSAETIVGLTPAISGATVAFGRVWSKKFTLKAPEAPVAKD